MRNAGLEKTMNVLTVESGALEQTRNMVAEVGSKV